MPPTTYTMVAFMKRKPGMSQEDFFKYWEDVHGPLVKPWAERFGLTYKQVRSGANPPKGPGSEFLAQFDGCAIFEYTEPDAFERGWADADFQANVSPDQQYFMDEAATVMVSGGTVTII